VREGPFPPPLLLKTGGELFLLSGWGGVYLTFPLTSGGGIGAEPPFAFLTGMSEGWLNCREKVDDLDLPLTAGKKVGW